MNVLEPISIDNPFGKSDECAKLTISETAEWFILPEITNIGEVYTFSAWIKSDNDGSATICDSYFLTSDEWSRHKITFTADDVNIKMIFSTPGVYYIYHAQLELGNIATDWSPAPEDLDATDEIADTNDRVQTIYNDVSAIKQRSDEIELSVGNTQKTIDALSGQIIAAEEKVSSMELRADSLTVEIQSIYDDGVRKVTTTTGIFDDAGLTIDRSDSPTQTQVAPDGMTVYKKDANGGLSEVLEATSNGVDATNLHAKTYLIVGGRGRYENYVADRNGCFWIGG